MSCYLKIIIKKIVPEIVIFNLSTIIFSIICRWKTRKARELFENAEAEPAWLTRDLLEDLQVKYPLPDKNYYGYDQESLNIRGQERSNSILDIINKSLKGSNNFLELGCNDGMVLYWLKRNGHSATGIDIRSEGFDKRAIEAGVQLIGMDAAQLQFEDNSFDFVFSFAAFEHFADPESVLKETLRVVKKGGFIYLNFGPLYMSSAGLHAYYSITAPYCQHLFPKEMLLDFVSEKGLEYVDFNYVNSWKISDYRNLWSKYSLKLEKIRYCEQFDLRHLDLIMKHTSCFRNKTNLFDNLIVSGIDVLFRKTS